MTRLGVVSFLNSRPLIDGLDQRADVSLHFDVPALLADKLAAGQVDAALIPLIDVLRANGRFRVVSDAAIACDGETMTVRVFSQVPPDRIETLWVDGDSHTSVALVTVLWRELYGRTLKLQPFDSKVRSVDDCASILLIGDKVITGKRGGFAYEVDLGAAWRQHTGLPFVFAVWAARTESGEAGVNQSVDVESLGRLLRDARDRGVARAREIAETQGPPRWWPVDLAIKYLTRCLKYKLDARYVEGADLFGRLCTAAEIVPAEAVIPWPAELASQRPLATR